MSIKLYTGRSLAGSFWQKFRKGLTFIQNGQSSLIWNHIRTRLYSTSFSFGLQRNLRQQFTPRKAKVELSVRLMKQGDADTILNHAEVKRSFPHIIDKRKKLVRAKIPTCYVAIANNTPCFMQWLMGPEQNEQIQGFFGKTFPKLENNEALLEGAFANPDFRGMGVMPEAMSKITEKATEIGVQRVITFVDIDNIPSLKGCKRAGFSPYILKKSRWLLFKRSVSYEVIPRDMFFQYHQKTGGIRKKRTIPV